MRSLVLVLACTLLSACDQVSPAKKTETAEVKNKLNGESLLSAANLYAYTQLSETLNKAQALDGLITSLLHHPNPGSLEAAQQAWIETYQSYLTVDFFHAVPRFEKPLHHENGDTYEILHEQLDSWPIEAGYIDYLPEYPLSGIINDMTLKISSEDIIGQHGFSDQRFASIGFHPLEFLLFGQGGQRSAKDFVPQENSIEIIDIDNKTHTDTEHAINADLEQAAINEPHVHDDNPNLGPQNHNRRRDFLRILSTLLVTDLRKLVDRWEPAQGYYAKQWRQPQHTLNVQRVYQVSMNTLQVEILDKHLFPLLNENELEDLRSPFANKDSANMLAILQGINDLFHVENGFISELHTREPSAAKSISVQFEKLLLETQRFPTDLTAKSLSSRKEIITPVQQDLLKLLESLYAGAEVLELPLAPLPVSTH
jgi:putative iron-regulated protein